MLEATGSSRTATPALAELTSKLQDMIAVECGQGSRVLNFGAMEDGHAGQTFGFEVVGSSGRAFGAYVLKVAPLGVARRGNTDVYRQAPLLRALKSQGMPVPDVPWASSGEERLGTPFIIMERMPGRVFLVWEPHDSFSRDTTDIREIWLQAARLLARLHRIDWKQSLRDWEAPQPLQGEFERWPSVLRHAQEPDWLSAGARARRLAGVEPAGRIACRRGSRRLSARQYPLPRRRRRRTDRLGARLDRIARASISVGC